MPGTATVTINGQVWAVSLAIDPSELVAGLGGVASIPAQTGMLFDLGSEQTVQVTTEPMLFNIDVIFISGDLEVVDVEDNVAPGNIISEATPVRYFLEVNAGEAVDVDVGDSVEITDYVYSPPSAIGEMMPQIMQIALLGFVCAMASGMMRGMSGGSHSSSPKRLIKPATHHSSNPGAYYWCLEDKETGERAESGKPFPTEAKARQDAKRFRQSVYGGKESIEITIRTKSPSESTKREEGWVYSRVGSTEMRGRKTLTGIEFEQVSPSYNQEDLDKSVKYIEDALQHTIYVTCPICKQPIEIPEWDKITRTEALSKHIEKEHSGVSMNLDTGEIKEHHSIHGPERRRLVDTYGTWAVGRAEAVCGEGDVVCVEAEAQKLLKAYRGEY